MRYLLNYLYHFFVSNSRHGTHSPFVYALAEKALYNPSYESTYKVQFPAGFHPKYLNHLNKVLSFWQIPGLSERLEDVDAQAYWVCNTNASREDLLEKISQGKIIVLDRPYQASQKKLWENLIADDRVIVSLNFFHYGILLNRKGQRKEDFLLRYV